MKKFGIDISHWQGDYNLTQAVTEGVEFVVLKGGGGDDGLYVDSMFGTNYIKAKALNLPVGVYWFTEAYNTDAAIVEAHYFYENCLKGKQFELPIYLDVEGSIGTLSVDELTAVVKAWCNYITDKGYYVGIYSTDWWFNNKMNMSQLPYTKWTAAWVATQPSDCSMWQFGGETNHLRPTTVAGCVVDQDYMYLDFPSIIKQQGLNGFDKEDDAMTAQEKQAFENLKAEVKALKDIINSHTKVKWGYIDKNLPSWATEDIKYLYKNGYLAGDENKNLQLSPDMLRIMVVISRAIQGKNAKK